MAESNILLTRVDNRLIHGQVTTQWNTTLGANVVAVANDEVAVNSMRQNIMRMAAPAGVELRFYSIDGAAEALAAPQADERVFLIVKDPQDALALVKAGVPIEKVNIGNMHMASGKRQVSSSVAVDDTDVATFKELQDAGVELEIRRLPSTPVEDLDKLFA